ncbi:MAG: thioesterase family protein [Spirochaetales bacterium]|nr:thioesterase family protein [Spirochaetales bacterium]
MKKKEDKFFVEIPLKAEFYDVDSMKIVWHGNYIKFYEQARCALLETIGYSYDDMEESGYAWPVVNIESKYIKPIKFRQTFTIRATLEEYENRLKISYLIYDKDTGVKINKGSSTQMAIDMKTGSTLFVSPKVLLDKVKAVL